MLLNLEWGKSLPSVKEKMNSNNPLPLCIGITYLFVGDEDIKNKKVLFPLIRDEEKQVKLTKGKNKKQILVVDDDEIIQDFFITWLERKGFEISVAKNGLEAVEMVQKRGFDLIFLDVRMPVMNGFEAFKRIKKINPHQKVIVMTGYANESLFLSTLELGAVGRLTKPFSNLLEISKMIDSILEAT